MALWGISTTTETAANNYAIPKHLSENDRNNTPWNCFADVRGWVYRRYHTTENSGLSTDYYDDVLVPIVGLNTGGFPLSKDTLENGTGLGQATPVAVFFEDPNLASSISIGAGGTAGIRTGRTGYVHVVWNENVYCSAGATINILRSAPAGGAIVAYATSVGAANYGAQLYVYTNTDGKTVVTNFNGQISNRVAFAFTSPSTPGSGIGTVLSIDVARGVVGTITDFSGGTASIKTFTSDIIRQVGGAGTYMSVHLDTGASVGIGTTTLTVVA
jgi:hypothetical protein